MLDTAVGISDDYSRARMLTVLAPHLAGEMLPRALNAARAISHEYYRLSALAAVASEMSADARAEGIAQALDSALAITDEFQRATALGAVAPHVPVELLPRALEAARSLRPGFKQSDVLAALATRLAEASTASPLMRGLMRNEWHRTVRSLGQQRREDLLSAMAALEPWSAALLKAETLADIASCVIEVSASVW
jgi:hypothetical protein